MNNSGNAPYQNTSRRGLAIRLAILALGLAGMGISGYLTYVHYRWVEPVCLGGFDCSSVLFSPYATLWGVPLSLPGLVMYSFLTIGALFLLHRQRWVASLSALTVYSLALSGTLYSIFLTRREFEMHAFCSWCLSSALVITVTLALSVVNLKYFGLHYTDFLRLAGLRLFAARLFIRQ
jgi:uncharacterized membrane protein